MRILALDTSSNEPSIALLQYYGASDEIETICQLGKSTGKADHPVSSHVTPLIETALTNQNWRADDLELIAVTIGPGSFTGLRVGVVTAKTLSYAHKIPLAGVNSLQVIAAGTAVGMAVEAVDLDAELSSIKVVINAQRGQLFSGAFCCNYRMPNQPLTNRPHERTPENLTDPNRPGQAGIVQSLIAATHPVGECSILDRDQWLGQLRPDEVVSGTGLKPVLPQVQKLPGVRIAPASCWSPSASIVGKLGIEAFKRGQLDDPWTLQPFYFRPSAAEEKRQYR